MLGPVLIVVFFVAIVYNPGAGLYFMITDKGGTDRMLKALTRRIALSVLLIALVMLGIWTGIIRPHGVGG
jgi:succinate dehydrogenase/fumarate reductase cytochrome b subunit